MKAVFLDQGTFSAAISLKEIAAQCNELVCYDFTAPNQVINRCLNVEIIITNKVLLNSEILQQLPQLKLICVAATGTNNIDLIVAKQLGIIVKNVSNYAETTVAQYVFSQLLEYFQQISKHNNDTAQGLWQQSPSFCYHGNHINELAGKTLGIIGYGNLGKSVANIARAFAMNVLISEHRGAKNIRSARVSFEYLLQHSDIISLHCPQTPETINLIDQSALSLMKNSALLINTARGALINNQALLQALKKNQIKHAILDVLEQEPPPSDHPLLSCKLPNLTITAHIAWASQQAQQRLINSIAENIAAFNSSIK
jgi:glycerate dehydrogenase